jgi:hypothetical protein
MLATEWGQAHDQNKAIAKAGAKAIGIDPAVIDTLEGTIGYAAVMKAMHAVGVKTGESAFVGGDGQSKFGNVMTPAQAQDRINSLRLDKDFGKRLQAGNVEAKNEWNRLHEMLAG